MKNSPNAQHRILVKKEVNKLIELKKKKKKMPRKKMPEKEKKVNVGITINADLNELLDERLKELGVSRSKYIQHLIREEIKK